MSKHMTEYAGRMLQTMATNGGEPFAVMSLAMEAYVADDLFLKQINDEYPPEALELLHEIASKLGTVMCLVSTDPDLESTKLEILERMRDNGKTS